jgi:hypothetical protein
VSSLLTPSMPDPQIKLYQRIAALEGRLASLERRRETVFTPISLTQSTPGAPQAFDFPWFGGRLWLVAGGSAQFVSASTGWTDVTLSNVRIATLTVTDSTPAGGVLVRPYPLTVVEVDPVATGITPGTVTLRIPSGNGSATSLATVTGLLVEWASA